MKVPSIISILWDIAKVYWFLLQDIRHQRDEERLESVQIPVGITSVTLHDDEFAYTARLDGLMVPASKCGLWKLRKKYAPDAALVKALRAIACY